MRFFTPLSLRSEWHLEFALLVILSAAKNLTCFSVKDSSLRCRSVRKDIWALPVFVILSAAKNLTRFSVKDSSLHCRFVQNDTWALFGMTFLFKTIFLYHTILSNNFQTKKSWLINQTTSSTKVGPTLEPCDSLIVTGEWFNSFERQALRGQ